MTILFQILASSCLQKGFEISLSNVKPWSQDWLIAAGAYTCFCSMKRLEVFLLPLDGMLVHRRSLPRNFLGFPNNLPVPIYTPGWTEALWELSVLSKNTAQCPRPGLEPGPLAPESSALTMRPPRLLYIIVFIQVVTIIQKLLDRSDRNGNIGNYFAYQAKALLTHPPVTINMF